MKIILLQDVKTLGKKGDVVEVSAGYARNMILPKKLGVEATAKNLNDLKLQNQHADKVAQENLEKAQELAKDLEGKVVEVKIRVEKSLVPYPPKRLRPQQKNRLVLHWIRKKCS